MTVVLSRVATRLPAGRERVAAVLARAGAGTSEQRMFDRIYRLRETRVIEPGTRFEDLLFAVGAEVLAGGRADLVLYGHTLLAQPMAYRPGFAGRLLAALGLPGDVPVHGITQTACTSVLRCVELAGRFLNRDGAADGETVLVLGGDQGSIGDWARLIPGVTVAGDGAAAVLVRRDTGRYRHLGGHTGRATRFHRNLQMTPEEFRDFGAASARLMVETAEEAVRAAGMRLADLDLILPHHNNALFWRGFARTTGVPADRIHLDLLPELGHSFGNDGLLALEHADRTGLLPDEARCLLTAIGQGAYFRADVVEVMAGC